MNSTQENHKSLLKMAQLYHSFHRDEQSNFKLVNKILKTKEFLKTAQLYHPCNEEQSRLKILKCIQDQEELLKTVQLRHSFNSKYPSLKIVNKILKKEGDINHKIPADSSLSPNLTDGTALHLAAFKNDIDMFAALLKNGANFTIQNQDGSTILHYVIENVHQNTQFLNSIFSAHIEYNIPVNPRNSKGISHFHIACLIHNVEAVEYFLDNNVSVDEAVNFDFHDLPGWTPLHIATRFPRMNLLQLLLKHKAKVLVKDATGMTPLHVLVEQKLDRFDPLNANDESRNDNTKFIQLIEDMMKLLLDSCDIDEVFSDDNIGLTHFQVACTLRDSSLVIDLMEQTTNLDHQIKMDSPVWPGYTALHFAAHCNIEIVKMLIEKGADVNVKDAKGVTPLDICLQNLTPEKALTIIEFKEIWKSVSFANGKTKLFDLMAAMENPQTFAKYLSDTAKDVNTCLPRDFVLWPGFTPLHLVVLLFADENHELTKVCLDQGADVTAQDSHGRTPLILAFRLNKLETVNLLLLHHHVKANPHDDEGLSHLHIACQVNNLTLLKDEKLSLKIQNVNIAYRGETSLGLVRPGSTPLHVAIAKESEEMIEILLDHQADCHAKDASDLTPIDWFLYVYPNLSPETQMKLRLLLTRELNKNADKDDGLTWLHVASCFNHEETVKKLLGRNVKVDPMISCEYPSSFWSEYVGRTPLHLAILRRSSKEVFEQLISNGADILAMRPNGMTPMYDALIGNSDEYVTKQMVAKLHNDDDLLRRLEVTSGITSLHIACHHLDKSFKENIDVNARVNDNCKIWPGCTALHLVVNNVGSVDKRKVDYHLEFLLDREADVTIKNSEGDTPVHSVFRHDLYDENHTSVINRLLNRQKDFSINPVGSKGISHFHAACIVNNVEVVEQFLKHGVDVNEPVDLFAPKFAGESPLHLAIDRAAESLFGTESLLSTVDLLLKNGAKVSAEDSYGNTVFHKAVKMKSSRMLLLEKLASREVKINSENIFGITPLETILKMLEIPMEAMQFFISCGCRVNAYHSESKENYINFIVSAEYHKNLQTKAIEALISTELDEKGRSALHHLVATDTSIMSIDKYVELIDKFDTVGIDVDSQDDSGLTPLHLATKFRNTLAIEALLKSSADVNITNSSGKSALVLATELYGEDEVYEETVVKLARHVRRLEALDLEVTSTNLSAIEGSSKRIQFLAANNVVHYLLEKVVQKSERFAIESNLKLRDLVSDAGPMADYPFMAEARRSRFNQVFQSALNGNKFGELTVFLKLQYKKAVRRMQLAEPSVMAVRFLFWLEGLSVPYECVVVILGHLSNYDLTHLLAAIEGNDIES